MQYFGYSVNIIFVIVALLLFQRIFLFHVQFVNGMNTSYVQIRNELASEQLIKVQFQVAMSGRYNVTGYPGSPPRLWVEFHPSFPVVSSNIALLPIPSKFGVYDAKRLNKSCSEFEERHLNVCYTTFI